MKKVIFESLPFSMKEAITNYFEENNLGDDFDLWLESQDDTDILTTYLHWEGIIGYTSVLMSFFNTIVRTGYSNKP